METERVTDKVKSSLGEETVRSQAFSTVCQRDKMLLTPPEDQKTLGGLSEEGELFFLRLSSVCSAKEVFKREKKCSVRKHRGQCPREWQHEGARSLIAHRSKGQIQGHLVSV